MRSRTAILAPAPSVLVRTVHGGCASTWRLTSLATSSRCLRERWELLGQGRHGDDYCLRTGYDHSLFAERLNDLGGKAFAHARCKYGEAVGAWFLAARRKSLLTASARAARESEVKEYLDLWTDLRIARSWPALARAADSCHTTDLLPCLRASEPPELLVWGEDDSVQFVTEIPNTQLVRIPSAERIPVENDAATVTGALTIFSA
ncbi:pimeloyl-ACP methyl ester carboxylesterase [Paraburkholderia sp. GAS334]